jgi:hypothetical protein
MQKELGNPKKRKKGNNARSPPDQQKARTHSSHIQKELEEPKKKTKGNNARSPLDQQKATTMLAPDDLPPSRPPHDQRRTTPSVSG